MYFHMEPPSHGTYEGDMMLYPVTCFVSGNEELFVVSSVSTDGIEITEK